MTQIYGYIRTSRRLQEGVPWENLFRDIGVSGSTGTQERRGWHRLDNRLAGLPGGSRKPPMHSPMDESWKKGNPPPPDSISAKDWKREYHQEWDSKKSLKDNLIQREEDAYFNSQLWMTPCLSLSLETLYAIGKGEVIEALIQEIGDYEGPAALLRDTADWLAGRREWRKAFRPVLDAAGYVDAADSFVPLRNE